MQFTSWTETIRAISESTLASIEWLMKDKQLSLSEAAQLIESYHVTTFPQIWPTAATGFGYPAPQTQTIAQTVVFVKGPHYIVCINSQFAYSIENPEEKFRLDFSNRLVAGKVGCRDRYPNAKALDQ